MQFTDAGEARSTVLVDGFQAHVSSVPKVKGRGGKRLPQKRINRGR